MKKKSYKYLVNEDYEYNERQLHQFHNNLELIQQHYRRVEIVRIDLYKIKHDAKLIDELFNCLNSSRKFSDNLIYYCYCLEHKPLTGDHYHFAFFFNPDTKFESQSKRSVHSMRPATPAWYLLEKMRSFFDRKGLLEVDVSVVNPKDDRFRNFRHLGVGIWKTSTDERNELALLSDEVTDNEKVLTINSVSFAISYIFKTANKDDGYNQKANVISRRKINSCQVRLPENRIKIKA